VATLPPFVDYVRIAVNDSALNSQSAFYAAQPTFNPNVVSRQDNVCYKSDVTSQDTQTKILHHEGSQWEMNPVSHAGVFKQKASSMVVPAAESVYTNGVNGIQGLRDRWVTIVFPVQLRVDTIAGKPVDQVNPVLFGTSTQRDLGCHFNYPQ